MFDERAKGIDRSRQARRSRGAVGQHPHAPRETRIRDARSLVTMIGDASCMEGVRAANHETPNASSVAARARVAVAPRVRLLAQAPTLSAADANAHPRARRCRAAGRDRRDGTGAGGHELSGVAARLSRRRRYRSRLRFPAASPHRRHRPAAKYAAQLAALEPRRGARPQLRRSAVDDGASIVEAAIVAAKIERLPGASRWRAHRDRSDGASISTASKQTISAIARRSGATRVAASTDRKTGRRRSQTEAR